MKNTYDSSSLEVLSGIEAVRRRPGMYTDTTTPNHVVMELVDNAVDEALSGHADHIEVTVRRSTVTVSDNGRGIPIADHPEHGVPGALLVFTRLHAGAKLGGDSYQRSGGLHGVGAAVANALSKKLEAVIHRDGRKMTLVFNNGEYSVIAGSKMRGKPTGTAVTIQPDLSFFDEKLDVMQLAKSLRIKAYLCPGLTVALHVITKSGPKKHVWTYDGGPSSMINRLVPDSPSNIRMDLESNTNSDPSVQASVIWQEPGIGAKGAIHSYVNLVPTPLGGSHVSGMLSGMAEAMNDYAAKRKLKPAKTKITAKDVEHEACMILSVGMSDPAFAGQTKEKLTSRNAMARIKKMVAQQCLQWLLSGPKTGDATIKRILESVKRRTGKTARKSLVSGPLLPGKLVDCRSTKLGESEIFLVEGDSAGGSARQARDSSFQAVLPLKGKIANTWHMTSAEAVKSSEVGAIIAAIGVNPGTDGMPRYGKICILADADADGLHIAVLLCTLFVRHFESLVRRGFIYVALPPRYRLNVSGKTFYARDEQDRDRKIKAIKKRTKKAIEILRFKGLGEMSAIQLRETAMNPDTRYMIRLTMKGVKDTKSLLDMLMSRKRSSDRRDWLMENGLRAET